MFDLRLIQENHWMLNYIPMEHNQVADCLAKHALIEKCDLQVLDAPPEAICSLIDKDKLIGGFLAQT
ncbi:hypothetical protein J1N35_002338 [Gossypium stocksii]|uniref:RNase H type-1 domain-containing protein n=1 Tax=Gossypium stocksii TaxID=47602 RepID=A0A9D3WKD4_9ROSI|nr:hypothetical protein J1N35_002338 [Gossypium stocksii]